MSRSRPRAVGSGVGVRRSVSSRGGSNLWTLLYQALRTRRVTILVWGLAMGVLGTFYVALYPSFHDSLGRIFEAVPADYLKFFGITGPIDDPEGFLAMEMYNILAPVALPFFTILLGAATVAGAEERQSLDLLLSNPVSRWELVVSRFLTMTAGLLAILAVMTVMIWLAAEISNVSIAPSHLARASFNLWPFGLVFGALALFISALVHRYVLAIAVPAAVLILMYVVNGLAGIVERIAPAAKGTIFYYYGSAIQNGIDWTNFLGLLGVAVILVVAAVVAFNRRDIYT